MTPSQSDRSDRSGSLEGDGQSAEEYRKERKKIQNRIHQRARRTRLKNSGLASSTQKQRPYESQRWRLDEFQHGLMTVAGPQRTRQRKKNVRDETPKQSRRPAVIVPMSDCELTDGDVELYASRLGFLSISSRDGGRPVLMTPSPSADHLLHLIKFNAFRGFFSIKSLLHQNEKHVTLKDGNHEAVNIMRNFPGLSTKILPSANETPTCLRPTKLQTQILHATWIDMLPFPRIRDNLILNHDSFDHWELMQDVIGDLLDKVIFAKEPAYPAPSRSLFNTTRSKAGRETTTSADKSGLILWGEPYCSDSWEATPAFLDKWSWAVEGCSDLIRSTNHWRALRHEVPINLEHFDVM